jgi:hypothetical protein
MRRISLLGLVLASLVLPGRAAGQAGSGLGLGAKLLFPTGDFDGEVKAGWGLAVTGEARPWASAISVLQLTVFVCRRM